LRDPESSTWFAEGGFINIVACGDPSRWIPDTVPLKLHGSGMTGKP
jgi:hypothetical protein